MRLSLLLLALLLALVVVAAGCPRTRDRLEMRGFTVLAVELSEIAKAEGAVTCCSLIFKNA